MRIVAGTARGRTLLGPKSLKIRPTADRVRESIFNILGQSMDGRVVLDLYAGTGALSFEALSRGAQRAVLVDADREAVRLCLANAVALGFDRQISVLPMPVDRALAKLRREQQRFDLVFADPPYGRGLALGAIKEVAEGSLLAPEGILCVEHHKRDLLPEQLKILKRVDSRRFGDTAVSFYQTSLTGS